VEPELVTVEPEPLLINTDDFHAKLKPFLIDTYKGLDKEEGFGPQDIARYPKFVTKPAKSGLSRSESVQAMAESTLHFRLRSKRSGRLMWSC
jgi:hypothetical protein